MATRVLGPGSATLQVNTYREGVAAKVGHDLVIDVGVWEATVDLDAGSVRLTADPRSLVVREGRHGVKPLTDKDRADIARTIDEKVLQGRPISFASTAVRAGDGGRIAVEGDLTLGGATRPLAAQLDRGADGRVSGTITLRQSDWSIKPYRGLMGALKVRDEVEVVVDAPVERSD